MADQATAHLDLRDALARLAQAHPHDSVELFRHGTLRVKLYAPPGHDPQTPHAQDEVYVIARGAGTFWDGEARHQVTPGTLLFAAAGRPHRFEDFSDDFATWVLFYGPDGGEAP
jgi:mannose-6-phosphate isomerase-like protein (cupin superfamily)